MPASGVTPTAPGAAAKPPAYRCEGEGLTLATLREPASFQLVRESATDEEPTAGEDPHDDAFFLKVQVRMGGTLLRTKMVAVKPGTITVTFTPIVSGEYTIDAWLQTEKLAGCPYTCVASARTAHAPNCSISGDGLHHAVSREQQTAEVRFRDAHGNVAHAEDLNCFAEAVEVVGLTTHAAALCLPVWLLDNASKTSLALGVVAGQGVIEDTEERPEDRVPTSRLLDDPGPGQSGSEPAGGGGDRESADEADPLSKHNGMSDVGSADELAGDQRVNVAEDGASVDGSAIGLQLVRPRMRAKAQQRCQQSVAWERRRAVEKTMVTLSGKSTSAEGAEGSAKPTTHLSATPSRRWKLGAFWNEVTSDPKGVGFAFGGVEPGRLHAKRKCVEVHKMMYAIGRAGKYRFHIGLRLQNCPLPGSPFELEVTPGPASPITTMVPSDLKLRGEVGAGVVKDANAVHDPAANHGCSLTLQTFDFMGNRCTVGGAKLSCASAEPRHVSSHAVDNGDGTYTMTWQSQKAGKHSVSASINGEALLGSPFAIELLPGAPSIEQTQVSASGVVTAGESSRIHVRVTPACTRAPMPAPTTPPAPTPAPPARAVTLTRLARCRFHCATASATLSATRGACVSASHSCVPTSRRGVRRW